MSMAKEELIRLIDSFINEAGLWYEFKAWIENQGSVSYTHLRAHET